MKIRINRFLIICGISLLFFMILFSLPTSATSEETYVFERMWPILQQPWYFRSAHDVAVDSNGYVYVADEGTTCVYKFTSDGQFVTAWGVENQFGGAYGIAVDANGYVYMLNITDFQIHKFTSDGQFVTKWGSHGSGDGEFNFQLGIVWGGGVAADSNGYVYVADTGNHRIQKFTADGQFVAKWGSYGADDGEFDHPVGIEVGSDGYVYVADTGNHRVQKFTTDGAFIGKVAGE